MRSLRTNLRRHYVAIAVVAIVAIAAFVLGGVINPQPGAKTLVHSAVQVVPTPYSCTWDGGSGAGIIMAGSLDDAGKQAARNGFDAHCQGVGGSGDFDSEGNRVKPLSQP